MTKSLAKDWAAREMRGGWTPSLDGDSGTVTCRRCGVTVEGHRHPNERDAELGVRRALVAHHQADCRPPETAA